MGIPEQRMGVAGFGQFQPVSPNDTASARQRNRRVEIYLLGPETPIVGWADSRGASLSLTPPPAAVIMILTSRKALEAPSLARACATAPACAMGLRSR